MVCEWEAATGEVLARVLPEARFTRDLPNLRAFTSIRAFQKWLRTVDPGQKVYTRVFGRPRSDWLLIYYQDDQPRPAVEPREMYSVELPEPKQRNKGSDPNGSWSQIDSGTTRALHSLWARTPTEVWAVGERGTVLHYNGNSWAPETVGVLSTYDLFSIWGSSDTNIWIGGERGRLAYFDGSVWNSMDRDTSWDLLAIWGTGPQDVWVLGEYDTYHLGQTGWTEDVIDVSNTWTAMGGTPGHIWVVGERRFILHRAP